MTDTPLDRRIHPYRPDLAALHLKGQVEAERFVAGSARRAKRGVAPLRSRPESGAAQVSQLLFGETFAVFEDKDGWSWGQSVEDDYVGYVESAALAEDTDADTHCVAAFSTHLYSGPSVKAPVLERLPLMAKIRLTEVREGAFAALAGGGWIVSRHVWPLGRWQDDFVAVAERFLGVPYLWGGRAATDGFDCSGLVQIALAACGVPCPRDSDMQANSLGRLLDEGASLKRGDLMFFPGHVGMMADETTLLHANAFEMCVSKHPLSEAIARIAKDHANPVTARRRLSRSDRPGSPGNR